MNDRNKTKTIPPTKVASGEGFTIEDKIGAICLTALLQGDSSFYRLPSHIDIFFGQMLAESNLTTYGPHP